MRSKQPLRSLRFSGYEPWAGTVKYGSEVQTAQAARNFAEIAPAHVRKAVGDGSTIRMGLGEPEALESWLARDVQTTQR